MYRERHYLNEIDQLAREGRVGCGLCIMRNNTGHALWISGSSRKLSLI